LVSVGFNGLLPIYRCFINQGFDDKFQCPKKNALPLAGKELEEINLG